MPVTATGSKFSRNNSLLLTIFCLAFAMWFTYDGWISDTYQTENTVEDVPNANLKFNRYAPVPLVAVALYSLIAALRIPSRKIIADQNGLTVLNRAPIAYASINMIDKRQFEKEGFFIIEYTDAGATNRLKLTDKKYDSLGLVLDELVKQTGAEPATSSTAEQTS